MSDPMFQPPKDRDELFRRWRELAKDDAYARAFFEMYHCRAYELELVLFAMAEVMLKQADEHQRELARVIESVGFPRVTVIVEKKP